MNSFFKFSFNVETEGAPKEEMQFVMRTAQHPVASTSGIFETFLLF